MEGSPVLVGHQPWGTEPLTWGQLQAGVALLGLPAHLGACGHLDMFLSFPSYDKKLVENGYKKMRM